jgi:hypothetical protein
LRHDPRKQRRVGSVARERLRGVGAVCCGTGLDDGVDELEAVGRTEDAADAEVVHVPARTRMPRRSHGRVQRGASARACATAWSGRPASRGRSSGTGANNRVVKRRTNRVGELLEGRVDVVEQTLRQHVAQRTFAPARATCASVCVCVLPRVNGRTTGYLVCALGLIVETAPVLHVAARSARASATAMQAPARRTHCRLTCSSWPKSLSGVGCLRLRMLQAGSHALAVSA